MEELNTAGCTEAGVRSVALDAFTVAALRAHLEMLNEEQQAFGDSYAGGGWLYVWRKDAGRTRTR